MSPSPEWAGLDPARRERFLRAINVAGAGSTLVQNFTNRIIQQLSLREFGALGTLVRKPGSGGFFDAVLEQGDKVVTNEALIPGVYHLDCVMQTWMKGFVYVIEHPYFAVTGIDGSFSIVDVPPGKYTAAVWHEQLGERTAEVEVQDGGTSELTFTYKP